MTGVQTCALPIFSFDVSLFSTIGFLSDYSWKVEGDCLYVRFYESLLPEGPLLGPFTDSWVKRVSIDVGRPLNRVVAVGKGWESVVWERKTPVHEDLGATVPREGDGAS